jgi:hypothetical protein
MEPICDRRGQVIAWLQGYDIYNLNGSHAAVQIGNNVYGHRGQQLGVFDKGFFRDHRGGAVAFINGATGGPITPIPSVPPVPPIPSVPPASTVTTVPRAPAVPSLGWGQEWQQFINT